MTDAVTGTTAAEKITSTESIMVGGFALTPLQDAILDVASTGTPESKPRFVKGRTLSEVGEHHLVLRGERGGLTILVTVLEAGLAMDKRVTQALSDALRELRRRNPGTTLRVIVPEDSTSVGHSNFLVEALADAYRNEVLTPSRVAYGASFHPLFVDMEAFEHLVPEPQAASTLVSAEPATETESAFLSTWNRVIEDDREVQFGIDGDSEWAAFAWAIERAGRDAGIEWYRAFKALESSSEDSLVTWLWEQFEDEMQDIAEERATLRDSDEVAA